MISALDQSELVRTHRVQTRSLEGCSVGSAAGKEDIAVTCRATTIQTEPHLGVSAVIFSVPGFDPEEAEDAYQAMAGACGYPVPEPGRRVASISFVDDLGTWTATVGERLIGAANQGRVHGDQSQDITERHAAVTVMAIFPGTPYLVVTNGPPLGNAYSDLPNPIHATPQHVELFEA